MDFHVLVALYGVVRVDTACACTAYTRRGVLVAMRSPNWLVIGGVVSSVSPNLPENYRYFAAKFCFGLVDNLLGNAGTGRYFARICSCFDTLILNNGVQGAICGS